MSGPDDGTTCAWPRCRNTDACCAVPHPAGARDPLPLCERHFEAWHLTSGNAAARAVLVVKLWHGRRGPR